MATITIRFKGGPGSGHFNHAGRPGLVGGSLAGRDTNYGKYADILNEAVAGLPSKSKAWRKKYQNLYNTDKEFRILVDTVTMYTQGSYGLIRDFAEFAATESLENFPEDSTVRQWIQDNFAMVLYRNPMADYDEYFEEQNINFRDEGRENKEVYIQQTSATEAGAILQKTIADSDPLDFPLYRGTYTFYTTKEVRNPEDEYDVNYVDVTPKVPEVGQTIDILGTTSFTKSESIAKDFAATRAKGQKKGIAENAQYVTVYEIEAGGKAVNASPLSPWNQEEFITSGRFQVVDVQPYDSGLYNPRRRKSIPGYRVKLRQIGVWDVDPNKYTGKRVMYAYAYQGEDAKYYDPNS